MAKPWKEPIALIGLGSIGVSFAALYLRHTESVIRLYDPRPDLVRHLETVLPKYLNTDAADLQVRHLLDSGRLVVCRSLEDVCRNVSIIQEQGPEILDLKCTTWQTILRVAAPHTHLWSSTSGITASQQNEKLSDQTRLLVVHPFNPPHVMPLIEIIPSPVTQSGETQFALEFFNTLGSGHQPVVLRKEVPGFVGNRLAFVLLREAMHLVKEGVVSVKDLDKIVENSIGPRWAVTGPFKAYNYGGGFNGIGGFLNNLSHTIQAVWDDSGVLSLQDTAVWPSIAAAKDGKSAEKSDWAKSLVQQVDQTYGRPTPDQLRERDDKLERVLHAK
ncbi:hypothetical protein A1O7_04944 [Cladophialophora yegresii CBS 114405]|uniref:3-hydroxyacyl-CoA dehydrogenase n=1 Tax=Cladophialophora yegresii CBS 114405 TaxID=1182544 RepID=W9W8D0_9EURO|nr:uncharacterized protein A1O7_04944 [Cladophialophora yegresii CBS 114405]EXJ60791.1 hypothetical protein A1O7_04944 [Cladophialophora yegresii CBS 114405]